MKLHSDFELRPARGEDAADICKIYAPIVESTIISFEVVAPGPEEMQARISRIQNSHVWLVCADQHDAVAAYAYASAHRSREAYQWSCEVSVYVAEQFRRMQLAAALYAALENCLRVQGFQSMLAGIALPNPASQAFHIKAGFNKIALYPDVGFKNGRWVSTEWYQKSLQPARAQTHAANPKSLNALLQQGIDFNSLLNT